MKNSILILIVLLCGLCSCSQKNYLSTHFIKDKKNIEKEAYEDLRQKPFYREQDSLRITVVYCFSSFDFDNSEIYNNRYLEKVKPRYRNSKEKRLFYDGYALDKNNNIVALIGCGLISFSFRPYIAHPEIPGYDEKYEGLAKNVFTQDFDLCFYPYLNQGTIWCVKGHETFIYKETGEMITLQEYYPEFKKLNYDPLGLELAPDS